MAIKEITDSESDDLNNEEEEVEEEAERLPPEDRPRLKSLSALKAKRNETKKIYIEFTGSDEVLEIEMRVGLSFNLLEQGREQAQVPKYPKKKARPGKPQEMKHDNMKFYEFVWKKLVVVCDPPATFTDIKNLHGNTAAMILDRIIEEYDNSVGQYEVLKKE